MKSLKIFFYGKLIAILKKSLKRGQSTLEYFILLALVLGITLVSVSTFLPKLRETLQGNPAAGEEGYSKKVADRIIKAAGELSEVPLPPVPTPIPIDIPVENPLPETPPASDPIKKTIFIDCPGLIYSNDQQSAKEPRLNGPLKLKPNEGIIIQYNSSYATTEDLPYKLWQIKMKDLNPNDGSSDLNILVKYGGEDCEYGAPTIDDYNRIINDPGFVNGTNGFYMSNTGVGSGEDKNVQVSLSGVGTGCIYVMVVNAGTGKGQDKVGLEIEEYITDNGESLISNPDAGTCFK